ncbi:LIRP-like [Armigeres subalbatus]|uniref:LIRP-like n=1 Tax=Armigeres subalbatus TaxID=124917 RepID=UPI002ED28CE8
MKSSSSNLFRALLMIVMQVTLLSLCVSRTHGSPLASPTDTASKGDGMLHHATRSRYCGRKLTETLAMLCQGRYPMMGHHRSEYLSDQPQPQVEVEVATLPDSGSHGFPYSRSKAHRRVRRAGIYDECCKKSCSYAELRSYCE